MGQGSRVPGEVRRELVAVILPEGVDLDWVETSGPPGPDADLGEHFAAFRRAPDDWLFDWGIDASRATGATPSLAFLHRIAAAFFDALTRRPELEQVREDVVVTLDDEARDTLLAEAPFLSGGEHLNGPWLDQVVRRLNAVFSRRIRRFDGTVAAFLAAERARFHPVGRVFFHLVEHRGGTYPFAFLATYASFENGLETVQHLPLKHALIEYRDRPEDLLALLGTVHQAAAVSGWVSSLLESGEIFQPLGLEAPEAFTFLREIPLYEQAGIVCRVPKGWHGRAPRPRLQVTVGERGSAGLDSGAVLACDPRLVAGEEALSREDLLRLRAMAEGLALIKGKWVEVNHAELDALLEAYDAVGRMAEAGGASLLDALRWGLNPPADLDRLVEWNLVEVTRGAWLEETLSRLTQPQTIEDPAPGAGFLADLREYQRRGVAWLLQLLALGLGACLADDMGLGKTVQVIAVLTRVKDAGGRALLVLPASLIGNWCDELKRFAPNLRVAVLHPDWAAAKASRGNWGGDPSTADVVLTTYSLVSRYAWVREVTWDLVVLDEAQAIKNPGTRQARAVKALSARAKIALTGTPMENRLGDLWSLFDFLNPGLLGTRTEFSRWTERLRQAPGGYRPLRLAVGPFILRRVKTDPAVITDLPAKIEMKTFAELTARQAALYTAYVRGLARRLETSEGIDRRGLVLAALLKLKQICNHPDQYLGQSGYRPEESGKFQRLGEIAGTVHERRERMLVFSQFREMTGPLADFLAAVFHRPGVILDGATPVNRRRHLVEAFQGRDYVPFMVLSIKAGGVGLNLTAANHVVHFDRWWNPAIENQATDRAFRIGQTKNVVVHKFVSTGTVEEKIDALIEEKTRIAQEIVPDMQETWITELDNDQLLDLLSLGA